MRRGGPQTRGPRWSVSRSMSWRWSGSTFVTLAGAIGVAVCALYAWRRRGTPAAASLALALLAATEWSLAHTVGLTGGPVAARVPNLHAPVLRHDRAAQPVDAGAPGH